MQTCFVRAMVRDDQRQARAADGWNSDNTQVSSLIRERLMATKTPCGVGVFRKPPLFRLFLMSGLMEVEIKGLEYSAIAWSRRSKRRLSTRLEFNLAQDTEALLVSRGQNGTQRCGWLANCRGVHFTYLLNTEAK